MKLYRPDERRAEALSWLKDNENDSAFAATYFGKTRNAITAVEKLYAAGAERVEILVEDQDLATLQLQGGEYSETLYVHAPEEDYYGETRKRLFCVVGSLKPIEAYGEAGGFTWKLWWPSGPGVPTPVAATQATRENERRAAPQPQTKQIHITPHVPERRVRLVKVDWFVHATQGTVDSAVPFLTTLRNSFPRALPTKFSTMGPLHGKATPEDQNSFIQAWEKTRKESELSFLNFRSHGPCFGGDVVFPQDWLASVGSRTLRPEENIVTISLSFDGETVDGDPSTLERLVGLFSKMARELNSFYGRAYVERDYRTNFRGLAIDGNTEHYPVPIGHEWFGIPRFPTWLSWYGREYASFVREPVTRFQNTEFAEGILLRLGDETMDYDQLAKIELDLPDRILDKQDTDFSVLDKLRPKTQHQYRGRAADFIPELQRSA